MAGGGTIAMIGYSGSGTTSLLDRLCGRVARNRDDAGIDGHPLRLPSGRVVAVAEVPSVLANLPHVAVKAFCVAADVLRDADVILWVQAIDDPEGQLHHGAVAALLGDVGIDPRSDARLLPVLTKTDQLEGTMRGALALRMLHEGSDSSVMVSAATGMGLDDLSDRIDQRLAARLPAHSRRTAAPVAGSAIA